MNRYTPEEVARLKERLPVALDVEEMDIRDKRMKPKYFYSLKDKKSNHNFRFRDTRLHKVLLDGEREMQATMSADSHDYLEELYRFLLDVPLEDVPLYLDRYPDIAKWRLEIAR